MPLRLIVSAFNRLKTAFSPSKPHPLHVLLEPILLTTRSAATKYHTELPKILSSTEDDDDLEVSAMWTAYNHDKYDTDQDEQEKDSDEFFERMERREAQIQILLYMLKLSLPGPSPPQAPPDTSSVKTRKADPKGKSSRTAETSFIDALEAFMDKMSMWQLVGSLEDVEPPRPKGERDWMQIFCEDVVEPQFKASLPSLCALFRSKVFPTSVFSDDEDDEKATAKSSRTRSSSPNPTLVRTKSLSRQPSTSTLRRSESIDSRSQQARARSRSLSVSLAHEREQQQSTISTKRMLNREVSMSRIPSKRRRIEPSTSLIPGRETIKTEDKARGDQMKDMGTMLVDETPIKPKPKATTHRRASASEFSKPLFNIPEVETQSSGPSSVGDDDEEWMLSGGSSPSVLLSAGNSDFMDDDDV